MNLHPVWRLEEAFLEACIGTPPLLHDDWKCIGRTIQANVQRIHAWFE